MFDTLVSGFSDDQEEDVKDSFEIFKGSKSLCDEVLMKTSYFGNEKQMEGEEKKDPILQYLQKYYMGGSGTDDIQLDESTARNDIYPSSPLAIIKQYFRMLETYLGMRGTSRVDASRCGHSMISWNNIIRFMPGSIQFRCNIMQQRRRTGHRQELRHY